MVCIPCIVIPVLLYIWHRFLQPIVLKFWNPWKQVNDVKSPSDSKTEKAAVEDSKSQPSDSKTDKAAGEDSELIKSTAVNSDVKCSEKITNGDVNTDHIKSQ